MHEGSGLASTQEKDLAQAKVTTDRDEIRKWTDARYRRPVAVPKFQQARRP
jgi:hypothetical protein